MTSLTHNQVILGGGSNNKQINSDFRRNSTDSVNSVYLPDFRV